MWVEGEKPLFRCQLVLDSTVATRDVHLHNLFSQIERLIKTSSPPTSPTPPPWHDVCNALKTAHAIDLTSLIAFMPTILNQLFDLMVRDTNIKILLNLLYFNNSLDYMYKTFMYKMECEAFIYYLWTNAIEKDLVKYANKMYM